MRISSIKQLNERLPEWVKRPFAPMIRRRLIANRVFLDQYAALVRADAMSEEERCSEQERLLQQALRHAYDHTAYYRRIMDERSLKPKEIRSADDLKRLPILTKKHLAEEYAALQADDLPDAYEVATGGTTGKPVHVLMERNAIYREWAFVYHYWAKFGYDYRTSRLATLRGVNMGKRLFEINPLYQEIRLNLFLMNRDNIQAYVRAAEKYGANFVYGYPSAVYNFCRLAREAGISLAGRFQAALLISENLYSFQEEEIAKTLRCPIAMFYGHSERAVFAEKYGEGYLFNPLYGVTEIGEDGSPIVTGFINGKMPLIRYQMDDQVEPIKGHEEVLVTGHWNADILEGKNGEQISAAAINFHDSTFNLVEAYQFIQTKPGCCVLNVVPQDGTLTDQQIEDIQHGVDGKFGACIACEVKVVPRLELSPRGKYKMIIIQNS